MRSGSSTAGDDAPDDSADAGAAAAAMAIGRGLGGVRQLGGHHNGAHAPPPLEERPLADLAPGLRVSAPLRVVALSQSLHSNSTRGRSGSRSTSTSPRRTYHKPAPSASAASPSRSPAHSQPRPLEAMFDDEPPPLEFTIPTAIPPLINDLTGNGSFARLNVPVPQFEKWESSSEGSRDGGSYDNDDDDDDDDYGRKGPKDEFVNGRGVLTRFEFKETQYFRYIEPSEEDLSQRIEYDMDEQDRAWLDAQNNLRHTTSHDPPIPPIVFEFVMDRLEKEYFDLLKRVPKPTPPSHSARGEDAAAAALANECVCAICDDGECENSNAIVFCDGCDLAVHQDCYGVPFIPEGQWLCRRCMLSPDRAVSCCFCAEDDGGALKQTNSNKWAHVVCAQWIPEAGFANLTYMEPIDARSVPASRYKLTCYICGRKKGACIQCSSKSCYAAYHVTCAKKCKVYMRIVGDEMKSSCDKHAPKEYRDTVDVEKEIFLFRRANNLNNAKFKSTPELEAELLLNLTGSDSSSHLRAVRSHSPPAKRQRRRSTQYGHSASVSPSRSDTHTGNGNELNAHEDGDSDSAAIAAALEAEREAYRVADAEYKKLVAEPVIPLAIFRAVSASLRGGAAGTVLRGKNAFIEKCCRYWALKRKGRRGAPLLKRLHLEPWTAATSLIQKDEVMRGKRMEFLRKLRNDLERVRMLCELVKKRERERLKLARIRWEITNIHLHPLKFLLRPILHDIRRLDIKHLFEEPVDPEEVPDYLTVVKKPMWFERMEEKLEANEYRSVKSFHDDFMLICSNAKLYNSIDTPWHRAADRLISRSEPFFASAFEQESLANVDETTGCLSVELPSNLFSYGGWDRLPSSEQNRRSVTSPDFGSTEVATHKSPPASQSDISAAHTPVRHIRRSTASTNVAEQLESPVAEAQQNTVDDQVLADELLAKALHEEELKASSPRLLRRALSSADEPNRKLTPRSGRRASLRLGGDTPVNAEEITEVLRQAETANDAARPLAFASVYFPDSDAVELHEEKPSKAKVRGKPKDNAGKLGMFSSGAVDNEDAVFEPRDFQLGKEFSGVKRKKGTRR
ncbi:nuA3 HAT complex component nto1 [Entophlyctis sp. JEL0112]|nr:nuA3 HAT complex component nto1 [Entophlyctis sp. JEL0112]